MASSPPPDGDQLATGTQLAELLRTKYASRWNRPDLVERRHGNGIHMAAIAKLLAAYLRDNPRPNRASDRDIESGQLRSLVSRALRGKVLAVETLVALIEAVGIDATDAEQLWRLWRREDVLVVAGDLPPPDEVAGYRRRQHDTLILHEHHWVGADRMPTRHRTLITLRSRVDGLASYQYRFDTPYASVRAVRGGTVGEIQQIGERMWAADVSFPRPLGSGQTHDVEYWTLLAYDRPPDPSMRRATHERIENLDLRVTFDPSCLPSAVRWTQWSHYAPGADAVLAEQPRLLDEEFSVDTYLRAIDRAVVGFSWLW